MHLTNFSINRKNRKFVQNNDQSDQDDEHSSKWDFKQLDQAYQKMDISFQSVFQKIKAIAVKTLISVEPTICLNVQKNPTKRANCFELFGFDVILDSAL